MTALDTSALGIYLTVVLAIAVLTSVVVLGTVAEVVVRNRRTRLARRQSLRGYYGARLALHH